MYIYMILYIYALFFVYTTRTYYICNITLYLDAGKHDAGVPNKYGISLPSGLILGVCYSQTYVTYISAI